MSVFPLQIYRLSQHFGSDQQRDGGEIILHQILSRARDLWSGASYWPHARARHKSKKRISSWDNHRSWISELRRADAARARSSQCCLRGDSSDHWSLSQEGTQKGERENRLPPARTNRQQALNNAVQRSERLKRDDRWIRRYFKRRLIRRN